MLVKRVKHPSVVVLKTAGINCDVETQYAFEKAGARSEVIHVNQFIKHEKNLDNYQIIVIPGGFSYGDDIGSGRVMAIELKSWFTDELLEHLQKGRLIIGICNGFQVLTQTGLLPYGLMQSLRNTKVALSGNDSKRFESRWIHIMPQKGSCPFIFDRKPLYLPVAHREGKFVTDPATLIKLEKSGHVVFRYCDQEGRTATKYPENPNGSMNAIEGVCDASGRIIGLMPHPERNIERYHNPNWRRKGNNGNKEPDGLKLIKQIVSFASQLK